MYNRRNSLMNKYMPLPKGVIIAGLDEAGRGPWAGPVVAAAVILPPRIHLPNLGDSKKLSSTQREQLYEKIIQKAHFGIGKVSNKEVDRLGLIKATNKAFARAVKALPVKPEHLLIDGRDRFTFSIPFTSIIRGDQKIRAIMAASIIAKVTRDRIMIKYAQQYPKYQFQRHKGYGTKHHQKALKKNGITPLHRKSYLPVQNYL